MDSDNNEIDRLLEKYWNCETTVEEENQLQDHFTTESRQEAAALFQYFRNQRSTALSDPTFDTKVMSKAKHPSGRVITLLYNSMRIAAGVVVLVLAVWLVRLELRESSPTGTADTYNDPDRAFEETKRALMMISRSFNTAEKHAKKINLFNEAQEEIRSPEGEQKL